MYVCVCTRPTDAKLALNSDALMNGNVMVRACVCKCLYTADYDAPNTPIHADTPTHTHPPPSPTHPPTHVYVRPSVHTCTQESTRQGLEKLLPGLRLEVDKSLRRLCAKGFDAAQYAWVLKAYLVG
jgi:hypothetical protein